MHYNRIHFDDSQPNSSCKICLICTAVASLRPAVPGAPAEVPAKDMQVIAVAAAAAATAAAAAAATAAAAAAAANSSGSVLIDTACSASWASARACCWLHASSVWRLQRQQAGAWGLGLDLGFWVLGLGFRV